jgi:hypothetical protein
MNKFVSGFLLPVAAAIIAIAFFYGVFAFGHWEVNPKYWDSFARGAFAFAMIWTGVMVFLMIRTELD